MCSPAATWWQLTLQLSSVRAGNTSHAQPQQDLLGGLGDLSLGGPAAPQQQPAQAAQDDFFGLVRCLLLCQCLCSCLCLMCACAARV